VTMPMAVIGGAVALTRAFVTNAYWSMQPLRRHTNDRSYMDFAR
jgi:hypothetical protein